MRLLSERFAPITYSVGFIEGSLERVGAALAGWRRTLPQLRDVEEHVLLEPLEVGLRQLDPLSVHRERELLVATESRWTAYFNAGLATDGALGPVTVLSDLLRCQTLAITDIPDTIDQGGIGTHGAAGFQLFDHGEAVRWIQAIRDGGRWAWSEGGRPLGFEDAAAYSARRLQDRFSHERLVGYCAALGIHFTEESFYKSEAILIRFKPASNARIIETSLAGRRQKLGLPPVGSIPEGRP